MYSYQSSVIFYHLTNTTKSILYDGFFFDTTCFDCPHRPSSGWALIHKKSKRGNHFLLFLCSNVLPEDGRRGQPKHVVVLNINITYKIYISCLSVSKKKALD